MRSNSSCSLTETSSNEKNLSAPKVLDIIRELVEGSGERERISSCWMEVYEIVEGLLKEENLNVMMEVTDPITFGGKYKQEMEGSNISIN